MDRLDYLTIYHGRILWDNFEALEAKFPDRYKNIRIIPNNKSIGKWVGGQEQGMLGSLYVLKLDETIMASITDGEIFRPEIVHSFYTYDLTTDSPLIKEGIPADTKCWKGSNVSKEELEVLLKRLGLPGVDL